MADKPVHHFFASSIATWAVTTDERDLRDLLAMFDKEGLTYNLWLVPGHHEDDYEIRMFAPQVEGTQYLGTFEPKPKKTKRTGRKA